MKSFKIFAAILITFVMYGVHANTVDNYLLKAMHAYKVPVVGYAIIENNRIVYAKTLSIDPTIRVSPNSLFQAASISKSVSAYGALKLVSQGKLSLNMPVNKQLHSWKIPANQFNKKDPVILRYILSMTSGLSVSGFAGYKQRQVLPSPKEILNGNHPANNKPIRVFYTPGSRYFYSGGGFEVLGQLMADATKTNFNSLMQHLLFEPLHMRNSVFQYPLKFNLHKQAIPGFLANGQMIYGGWHNYAIRAAGGLWSTPTDLAKFAINISKSYKGMKGGLLPKQLAREMLQRQRNSDFGLGVIINGHGENLNFRKTGHNLGYHSLLIMFPNTGQGLVIMTNSENGLNVINYVTPIIAHKYHWPCYFPYFDELISIPGFAC